MPSHTPPQRLLCAVCSTLYRDRHYHCHRCHRTFRTDTALLRHHETLEGAPPELMNLIGLYKGKDGVWAIRSFDRR